MVPSLQVIFTPGLSEQGPNPPQSEAGATGLVGSGWEGRVGSVEVDVGLAGGGKMVCGNYLS